MFSRITYSKPNDTIAADKFPLWTIQKNKVGAPVQPEVQLKSLKNKVIKIEISHLLFC